MGCGHSGTNYTVQYCSLDPIEGAQNKFKINLIAEEKIPKLENVKFIYQIGNNKNPEIEKFLKRENLVKKTIFYYYLRNLPLLKTYNQSVKYVPFNLPSLTKIVLLSLDLISNFPVQIIENETLHLTKSEIVGTILDLNEIKQKIELANNPDITKDSLSLKEESIIADDDSIKEKDNELLITNEITMETLDHVQSKFESQTEGNNPIPHLETSDDNPKTNKKSHSYGIKSVKIFGAKIDDIHLFSKLMEFLEDKNIRKFSFFENSINSDFEGWDSIATFFENDNALRYVDLHGSNIYDYALSNIMRSLTNKRIRYLNLSENFITLDGIESISNYLEYNKTLQKINLCRNAQGQFKPEGVELITKALRSNPNINYIDFSYMNLTGCGVHIGEFITNSKNIETIVLRNVQLNALDFKNIFVPLKTNTVLKEIDISMNDMGGDKSLQYIADAIVENKTLKKLKMDQININNDNYHIIFDAIEKNKTITHYTVNYNSKINPKIMIAFFSKQKQVKYLEYEPFDKENPEDKKKELTLEEKKLLERLKTQRPDMKVIYK